MYRKNKKLISDTAAGAADKPLNVELSDPAIAPYAALSCVISFLITGHRSVYPSQILSISKSPSLRVEVGKEIEEIKTTLNLGKKGFITRIFQLMKKIEEIVDRIQRGITSSHNSNDDTSSMDKK